MMHHSALQFARDLPCNLKAKAEQADDVFEAGGQSKLDATAEDCLSTTCDAVQR